MNITTLTLLGLSSIVVVALPQSYDQATKELYRSRWLVASSREPCPRLAPTSSCAWRVQAKAQGEWTYCRDEVLPSGAALPSHRYFKIIPKCRFAFGIPLLLPPQVVYR